MTFDPFGDYASRGYLRNHAAQKELETVKQLEHAAFRGNVGKALAMLEGRAEVEYDDIKSVHRILFSSVYPWAGEDRLKNAPDLEITKAGLKGLFGYASEAAIAANHALKLGQDPRHMREHSGEVMGYLAYAHPFLEENRRTIMTVHADLCRRAGIHIDWSATAKTDYLNALTRELQDPGKGHLDTYLNPFIRTGVMQREAARAALQTLPGLGTSNMEPSQQAPLIPSRQLDTTITKADIAAAAEQSRIYVEARRSLEFLADKVFAEPAPIVEEAHKAAFEGKIGDRGLVDLLKTDAQQFGRFRGRDGIMSGRDERQEFRNAVSSQYALHGQVREFISLVHGIRQQLTHERHDLAERGLQTVPAPSAELMETIRLGKPLSDDQAAEVRRVVKAFEQRFGEDVARLRSKEWFKPELATKHGVDPDRFQDIRATLRRLDKGLAQVREQERSLERSQTMTRGGPTR